MSSVKCCWDSKIAQHCCCSTFKGNLRSMLKLCRADRKQGRSWWDWLTFQPLQSLWAAQVHPESPQLLLPQLLFCSCPLVFGQLLQKGLRLQEKRANDRCWTPNPESTRPGNTTKLTYCELCDNLGLEGSFSVTGSWRVQSITQVQKLKFKRGNYGNKERWWSEQTLCDCGLFFFLLWLFALFFFFVDASFKLSDDLLGIHAPLLPDGKNSFHGLPHLPISDNQNQM